MQSLLRRVLKGIAVACIVLVAVSLVAGLTPYKDVDRLTYDFTVDYVGLGASSPQIVVVDFDEESYRRSGGQFPIPRPLIAETINRVAAAKPRVIGLDIFLDNPRNPVENKLMQDALTAAGNVIVASQAPLGQLPRVMPLPEFCQPDVPQAITGFCVDGAPGAMGYGFVNMPIDSDGFIRQAFLFTAGPPRSISFPMMLATQYAGESIKPGNRSYSVFLGRKFYYADREVQSILIGRWGKDPATRIPAWKLFEGKVPPQIMTDKLVMIGQSNDASKDNAYTPLFRMTNKDGAGEMMGGTSIHAATVRTLLEGGAVRPSPMWLNVLWVMGGAAVAATMLLACDLTLGIAGLLAMMLLGTGISLLLYAKLRFWLPFLQLEASLSLTLPFTLGMRFVEEQLVSREASQQREQLMGLFSSYVDPAVAETIWERRSELSLNGEEHVATVMFTDIRGFTALSANQPPALVLSWLNRYVVAMDEVIREHGGFLNKFIGDGLMIIFGLPLGHGPREDAKRALEASLAMLARVERLNEERVSNPQLPHLRIGIGIHTGSLMAGSIGSANRQEYSVIGETVNLASRLESLNKKFGTEILMSAATMELVADLFPGLQSLGETPVAGLQEPVPVYTLRAFAEIEPAKEHQEQTR